MTEKSKPYVIIGTTIYWTKKEITVVVEAYKKENTE